MNNNKTLLIILILLSVIILGGYFYLKPYKKISENNYSFYYPKNLFMERSDVTDRFIIYRIYDNINEIRVNFPIKASSRQLFEYIEPQFRSQIEPFELNGHKGEYITYRLDRQLRGDIPVHGQFTVIYLESEFKETPVILEYVHIDNDNNNNLDEAWKLILKTLKY
jgi:hypothetical protein